MDRVIVKDVSGGVQTHTVNKANVKDGFLYLRAEENHTFAYNIDNLISYSITTIGKGGKKE